VDVTGATVYVDFLVETGERVDLTGATVYPDFLVETVTHSIQGTRP
jgi:hypothetical protein